MTDKQHCGDCKLDLPVKHFPKYLGKRHPLCRTCLAIDVAEFKEWVLPHVERRRAEGPPWRKTEDWEIAVKARLELSGHDKAALLCRPVEQARRIMPKQKDPAYARPWKYEREAA